MLVTYFVSIFFRTEYSENDSATPVIEAITKAPSRCMHLPLQQVLELLFYTLGNIVISSNVAIVKKKLIKTFFLWLYDDFFMQLVIQFL